MKTNNSMTNCPKIKRHFLYDFRTFNTNVPVFCRILPIPSTFLSLFERFEMNSTPQHVQNSGCWLPVGKKTHQHGGTAFKSGHYPT